MANISFNSIVVHRREGLRIPVVKTDAQKNVIDISGRTVKLYIRATDLAVTAVPDASVPSGLLITVTEAQIAAIANATTASTPFVLVDESNSPDTVMWSGMLTVVGF